MPGPPLDRHTRPDRASRGLRCGVGVASRVDGTSLDPRFRDGDERDEPRRYSIGLLHDLAVRVNHPVLSGVRHVSGKSDVSSCTRSAGRSAL